MDSNKLSNIASGTAWSTGAGINNGFLSSGGYMKGIMTLPLTVDGKIQYDEKGNALMSTTKCFFALWHSKKGNGNLNVQFGAQAFDKKKKEDEPKPEVASEVPTEEEAIPVG